MAMRRVRAVIRNQNHLYWLLPIVYGRWKTRGSGKGPDEIRLPVCDDRRRLASDSDAGPDITPTWTPNSDIDVTAQPAAVAWRDTDGQDQSLSQVNLDLHYNVRSCKAFFKVRAAVALKAHARARKTNIFLFIYPERIRAVALDESPCAAEAKTLGPDAIGLRFELTRASALVVPKDSLAPRNQASGSVLDSMRALAKQTTFVVYSSIPCRTLPRQRLISLCEAASRNELSSLAAHSNSSSLYAGVGGRVIEGDSFGDSAAPTVIEGQGKGHDPAALEVPAENPPSYDELPPRSHPEGPGPYKRRRVSSPEPVKSGLDRKYIEDICAHVIDNKLSDLRRDVTKQLQELEARVMEYVDESLLLQRKDMTEDISAKIEDEYYGVKLDLQSYVREEVEEAEGRKTGVFGQGHFNPSVPVQDAVRALVELVSEGTIGGI
ncbi:hypothetical protein SLS62_006166 [Diatrype stigma]|uniref:Uncharacterized protein n=1 Tax=Diatrype stigma TaxID=117547 RepID=A0AAN9YS53_9PEZI